MNNINELYALCYFYLSACDSLASGKTKGLKYKAIFDFVKTIKSLSIDYEKGNLKDIDKILGGLKIECEAK